MVRLQTAVVQTAAYCGWITKLSMNTSTPESDTTSHLHQNTSHINTEAGGWGSGCSVVTHWSGRRWFPASLCEGQDTKLQVAPECVTLCVGGCEWWAVSTTSVSTGWMCEAWLVMKSTWCGQTDKKKDDWTPFAVPHIPHALLLSQLNTHTLKKPVIKNNN